MCIKIDQMDNSTKDIYGRGKILSPPKGSVFTKTKGLLAEDLLKRDVENFYCFFPLSATSKTCLLVSLSFLTHTEHHKIKIIM